MKRALGLFFGILLFVSVIPHKIVYVFSAEQPEVSAKAAVLISADTGEKVWEHNSGQKLPMASTTKIMTTLLCIESGGLDVPFQVDSEAIKVEGSSMGLQEGDIVTKYDLCCGMLLPSGNDAANAAAVRIAGSIEKFAELMNERARKLGLSKTYFVTPSGLEGDGHGSSAADMALLAREALRNDVFRSICSKSSIKLKFGAPPYDRWLKNTNKLLTMYEGVYGVKTGFTDEAGRCLVSACERDGKSLICVTLNDKNDWNDHIALYDYGFNAVHTVSPEIPDKFELELAEGGTLSVTAGDTDIEVTSADDNMENYELKLIAPPFVYAPVKSGDETAQLKVLYNGREVKSIKLYAAEDVPAKKSDTVSQDDTGLIKKIISKLKGILP
ncbi:MAG: D-alanyl-D-alanine carboxypeptidase [Ruminococcus sp.]|nr:D-alanyl-D-alanine carboxypeptidase [Ruminococcus sp.]